MLNRSSTPPRTGNGIRARRVPTMCRTVAVGEVEPGQGRQVERAGVVVAIDDPAGACEVRAGKAEPAGAAVHPGDEAPLGSGVVLGEGDRGVVARDQHQAVEQRPEPHPLSQRQHPDPRPLVVDRLRGDPDQLPEPVALGDDQRGEHLREAGDRQLAARVKLPEDLAASQVEEQPGRGRLRQPDSHRGGAPGRLHREAVPHGSRWPVDRRPPPAARRRPVPVRHPGVRGRRPVIVVAPDDHHARGDHHDDHHGADGEARDHGCLGRHRGGGRRRLGADVRPAQGEQLHNRQPEEEAADVGEVGDPAAELG